MKKIFNKLKFLIEEINVSYIDEHAAGCAYYTILAFIPLILLILTLTKYFGIDKQLFIFILQGIVPGDILNDAVLNIVEEVYSKSFGTITVSALVTLWSAGKGFFALCKGLSAAYGLEYDNKYMHFRLRAIIATVVFIILIVLSLLLLVFGNRINIFLQERFNIFSKIINLVLNSKTLISIFALTIILTIMYKFIPKHKFRLRDQIPGAIIAAVSCNIISVFYSLYVEIFTGFSLMYGSLTTIVFAMLWIYACMYSILIGAVINRIIANYVENKK